MVLGYFGKTPKAPDKEVVKIASEQLGLEPTRESPRLLNDKNPNKGIAFATEKLKANNLPITDENIFIAATCSDKGIAYLKGEAKVSVRYKETQTAKHVEAVQRIVVNGQTYDVELNANEAVVNGKTYTFDVLSKAEDNKKPLEQSLNGANEVITSPMLGAVIKVNVRVGDSVKAGQDLMILEVMKMENPIKAPKDAVVKEILVSKGTQVSAGQKLIVLG